ncbi:F-box family protein [Striga asiatica]|uniref:F-box family protein n=1 Tax=Striga asiatica TaxID=4170 RepID=A0A5A7PXJ0_STRAF|nr:F-box family protein [Striga asiatica]
MPYLPEEIVLIILSRLPAKSLHRFKSVCRSWRSAISSDLDLLRAHTRHFALHHSSLSVGTPRIFRLPHHCPSASSGSCRFRLYTAADGSFHHVEYLCYIRLPGLCTECAADGLLVRDPIVVR